jgi:microcompartment protein CcmK/EutM
MKIGKVMGRVVCHTVYEGLEGVPLLWIQPWVFSSNSPGSPQGKWVVAADSTRCAGQDEWVSFEGGREAAMALEETFVPVDHTIIGILDHIHVAGGES